MEGEPYPNNTLALPLTLTLTLTLILTLTLTLTGSILITQVFEEACDATCVLLPIGASDDGAHSQNEKIDRANYLNGVKTLGAYLDELGRLPRGADGAGEAEARASRAASKDWRRRCKKDMISFGCDCCL